MAVKLDKQLETNMKMKRRKKNPTSGQLDVGCDV